MYFLDFSDLYNIPPDKPINLAKNIVEVNDIKNITKQNFPNEKVLAIYLKNISGNAYYDIKTEKREFLIDQEKQVITKISEKMVENISKEKYTGSGKLDKVELLNESKGNYYSSSPIYRVSYDDSQKSEMYINPNNGELLAKRKALWGFYNTMWEYHLMKYTSNSKLNKNLLLLSAIVSLFVSVTGFLKFFRFKNSVIH